MAVGEQCVHDPALHVMKVIALAPDCLNHHLLNCLSPPALAKGVDLAVGERGVHDPALPIMEGIALFPDYLNHHILN